MIPIRTEHGCGLWYSRDDGGYYWQDRHGAGDWTSRVYRTVDAAVRAMRAGRVKPPAGESSPQTPKR
jgi:hypothetical protein